MMEEKGNIEIKFTGEVDERKLSPADVDISDIKEIIVDIETFLYPERIDKKNRPKISYTIEDGSVLHKFTSVISSIILFNGLIGEINNRQAINFLDYKRASIIDKLQRKAAENNLSITLKSSVDNANELIIDKHSKFYNTEAKMIISEFIIYGEVYLEGGKSPNLHMDTKDYGRLTISTTKEQITEGGNRMYKINGVRVSGKQDLESGQLSDLKLINFIEYDPSFNLDRLNDLINKSKERLADIGDVNEFVTTLRGGIVHG